MRYTGTRHTQEEAEAIMREARARLADKPAPRDERIRRRDHGADMIYKTVENARTPASETSVADAQTVSWTEWVDARIAAAIEYHAQIECDATAEYVEHGLREIRRELKLLRDQVEVEIKLNNRIAALNTEVAQARQQAPDFRSDLNGLQAQVDKFQKSVGRLGAEHSMLEYRQRQAEQREAKEKVTLTAVQLSAVGQTTREIMRKLRDSGFDLSGMAPSGLLS